MQPVQVASGGSSPAKSGIDKWKKKGANKKVTLSKSIDDDFDDDDVTVTPTLGAASSGTTVSGRPTTARGASATSLLGDTGSTGNGPIHACAFFQPRHLL